jgi:hypothetical protein
MMAKLLRHRDFTMTDDNLREHSGAVNPTPLRGSVMNDATLKSLSFTKLAGGSVTNESKQAMLELALEPFARFARLSALKENADYTEITFQWHNPETGKRTVLTLGDCRRAEAALRASAPQEDGRALESDWTTEQIAKGVRDAAAFCDCSNHPDATEWANACRLAALALSAPPSVALEAGAIADIAAERQRQISKEDWTPEHDDSHRGGELAIAAGWYALNSPFVRHPECIGDPADGRHEAHRLFAGETAMHWPWSREWWKPKDSRSDLVRAAALIVAEIERLDRAITRPQPGGAVAGTDHSPTEITGE